MGAGQGATEFSSSHGFGEGNQNGHVFRLAARHHRIDGHMPRGSVSVGNGQHGNGLVPRVVGVSQKLGHLVVSGRDEGQSVAPIHFLEVVVDFVQSAVEGIIADVTVVTMRAAFEFFLGNRCRECLHNLWPKDFAGVLQQLFGGVGGKGSWVDGYTHHGNAIIVCRVVGLVGKARPSDDDRRDADVFRRDARPRFFRCAQATAAVAADNRIHVHGFQLGFKLFLFLSGDARGGVRSRHPDFIQQDDLCCGIVFINQPLQFGMGDMGHETLAHDGNGFAFQSLQTRRHLNHFHGTATHGRHHGIIGIGMGRVKTIFNFASLVTDDTLGIPTTDKTQQ